MSTNPTEISRITRIDPPRQTIAAATIHMRDYAEAGIDFSDCIEARAESRLADVRNETTALEGEVVPVLDLNRRAAVTRLIRALSRSFMGDQIRVSDMKNANDLWLDIQSLIVATEMAKGKA
ncbi:hypothetical protein [Komagataeibacter oboediens]|uniref:Uncharacterized protein n=1 Tax=Komagataeibacter oboediens TaxID=65958 RepID=A0ABS5SR45_9PROT|nr:hypothetical protein [Komagataeibacter oboediens]MBL7233354.1 hypothetical protein [Komagataeibacter oboediens]MBT0676656.1 hypothetical protein [Komagataeibacter oboediens]MBT0678181.1 hypothetical protein [Komagataeibacter oboediens]